MKYWGINCGKIIEGFSIFPSVLSLGLCEEYNDEY